MLPNPRPRTAEEERVSKTCVSFFQANRNRSDFLKRFACLVADQLLDAYRPIPIPQDQPEILAQYWRLSLDERRNFNRSNPGWYKDSDAQEWVGKRNSVLWQNKGCYEILLEMADEAEDEIRSQKLRKKAEEYSPFIDCFSEAERVARMFEGKVVR